MPEPEMIVVKPTGRGQRFSAARIKILTGLKTYLCRMLKRGHLLEVEQDIADKLFDNEFATAAPKGTKATFSENLKPKEEVTEDIEEPEVDDGTE